MYEYNTKRSGQVPLILFEGGSGAGKGTASLGLQEFNPRIRRYQTGDFLRGILGSDATDAQLYEYGKEMQSKYGMAAIEKIMADEAQRDYEDEIIDGAEIDGVRRFGAHINMILKRGALSIYIPAPRSMRYEWRKQRNKGAGDRMSKEDFVVLDRAQGRELRLMERSADFVIPNLGTKEELVDSVIIAVRSKFPQLT